MGGAGPAAPPESPDAGPRPTPPVDTGRGLASVEVSGYQLLVRWQGPGGTVSEPTPFDIRGISWSPAQKGAGLPGPGDYLQAAGRDLPLMQQANINVVKTYVPVDRALLDRLLDHGMVAIVTVLPRAGDPVAPVVEKLRDHPALLMWLVGNEWNYNNLYGSCAPDACYDLVNQTARQIKALDPKHPVATSFAPKGELPSESDLRRLDAIDVWGLNVYSQPGFFNRFVNWRVLGLRSGIKKPFFMSEYGTDAFDQKTGRPNEAGQAEALRRQTAEIRAQLSSRNPGLPCLGGTPFEWNDEWWKHGNPGAQDSGGFANPGVAVDEFANEEWWGIVDVERRPRMAYQVLKELYAQ